MHPCPESFWVAVFVIRQVLDPSIEIGAGSSSTNTSFAEVLA
jgi:hypothetical protein